MRVNLYINGVCVKTIKNDESLDLLHKVYKVTVINHKEVFPKFITKVCLKPMQIIDSSEKEVDLNCAVWGGTNID